MTHATKQIMRKVNINFPQDLKYLDNSIKTAKYNIVTFLPFAIIFQFNNYFNIFFLVSAVLLSIPVISPVDPASSIIPFVVVILISVIREGLEDYKKAKYDKTYNNSIALQYDTISSEFVEVKWKDINLGRILKVQRDEIIPADLLVIKSLSKNGFCHLQTTNLDGESTLKPREAPVVFQEIIKRKEDLNITGYLEVDPPDNNIYRTEGAIYVNGREKSYFDINNILLRGGSLKNVDYIYGIVIYTGKDTKIMKNIQHGSLKLSSIDQKLNIIVIYVIVITLIVTIICTALGMLFWLKNKPDYPNGKLNMDIIYYSKDADDDMTLELLKTFASFFAIFNTLIPISLMITLEVVKTLQIFFLDQDNLLRELPEEKCKFLSMKLQEDLGNVKYIFTDKTGTLTRNEMLFKACSIFTHLFESKKKATEKECDDYNYYNLNDNKDNGNPVSCADMEMNSSKQKPIFAKGFDTQVIREALQIDQPICINDDGYIEAPFISLREASLEFFLNIALNQNVFSETDPNTNKQFYTGANPDEIVLVEAAKEIGVEFIERNGKFSTVKLFNDLLSFEVLYRFEFTSSRMRSSIIVQDKEGVIKLYMKGSDSVLLKKIDDYSKDYLYKHTKEHLDKFAKAGLRTLCYSMKTVAKKDFLKWEAMYKPIQSRALEDKSLSAQVDQVIASLEDNMTLMGATALEDKLQDEVKPIIKEFIESGVNVWMLTGDKLDTAESIGYSCRLFNADTEVFRLPAGKTQEETLESIKEVIKRMDVMEKELVECKINTKKRKRTGDADALKINQIQVEKKNDVDNNKLIISPKKPLSFCQDLPPRFKLTGAQAFANTPNIPPQTNSRRPQSGAVYNSQGGVVDIEQMNDQIKNNNIKFIGSDIDPKSNMITLNFIKKTSVEQRQSNHQEYIYQPPKGRQAHTIPEQDLIDINSNPEATQEDEVNDVSIIKYIVDKHFLDDSLAKKSCSSLTLLHYVLGKNKKENSIESHDDLAPANPEINNEQLDFAYFSQNYKKKIKEIDEQKAAQNLLNFTLKQDTETQDISMRNFGLIIEGTAITQCMTKEIENKFWECLQRSRSVICCRCAPIQKSEIVSFMKNKSKDVTLAIGDGGNDVSMIRMANVGVGIFGKEGSQAAYSADYAISQFKYLRRLLLVHGRYFLMRNSYFIYIFFYKNIVYTIPQFWFALFSGVSGTLLWDDWYYLGFNSFLTTVPPCVRMAFEEDIDVDFAEEGGGAELKELVPDIYKEYRESSPFNIFKFFCVFLVGIAHSCVVYYIPIEAYDYAAIDSYGRCPTILDQSLVSFASIITTVYYIIITDTFLFNLWTVSVHCLQMIAYIAFVFIHNISESYQISGRFFDITSTLTFWLTVAITVAVTIIPFQILRTYENLFSDSIINHLRHQKYQSDSAKRMYMKKLTDMQKCSRSLARFKKILKEKKDYEPDNLANKKIKELVDGFKESRMQDIKANSMIKDNQKYKEKLKITNLNPSENRSYNPIIGSLNDKKIQSLLEKLNRKSSMRKAECGSFKLKTIELEENEPHVLESQRSNLIQDRNPQVNDYPLRISEDEENEDDMNIIYVKDNKNI